MERKEKEKKKMEPPKKIEVMDKDQFDEVKKKKKEEKKEEREEKKEKREKERENRNMKTKKKENQREKDQQIAEKRIMERQIQKHIETNTYKREKREEENQIRNVGEENEMKEEEDQQTKEKRIIEREKHKETNPYKRKEEENQIIYVEEEIKKNIERNPYKREKSEEEENVMEDTSDEEEEEEYQRFQEMSWTLQTHIRDHHRLYRILSRAKDENEPIDRQELREEFPHLADMDRETLFLIGLTDRDYNGMDYGHLSELDNCVKKEGLLSVDEVKNIPICTVNLHNQTFVAEECTICMEIHEKNDRLHLLTCKHMFHERCFREWMMYNKHCPLCKQEIIIPTRKRKREVNFPIDDDIKEPLKQRFRALE